MALIDLIGVASILPFVAVLTNQSLIETNIFINTLFNYSNIFGIYNYQHFLFFLGILVFFLLILSLTFKAITHYFQNKFIKQVDQDGQPVVKPMENKPENKREQDGRGAPALLYTRNKKAKYLSYIMLPTQKR